MRRAFGDLAWPIVVVAAMTGCMSSASNMTGTSRRPTGAVTEEGLDRGDRVDGTSWASRSPVWARHGMAATAHPLATRVAVDVLQRGGTAVDAAIAANAALGLLEPVGCGVGGDLFALVWDPDAHQVVGLDASGRSPQRRSLEDLKARLGDANAIPPVGSLSVTVPGAVDGWFMLHERYGALPMAELLAPAIRYAREGTPVPETIAHYWARNIDRLVELRDEGPWLEELDNALATYAPGGRAPRAGEIFRNPDLARTYELIAEGGRTAFYEGAIAEIIEAYMQRIGGDLEAVDLAAHEGQWVEPISVEYRGYRVYELPPSTQGLAALQMLAMVEPFDLSAMGPGSPDALHLLIEAKRLAFEDRARYYADPDFSMIPPRALLDPEYVATRRELIDPSRAQTDLLPGEPRLDAGDTTYLTVADERGMMVSLIQSNYRGMGSGLVPDGLGFMLQDRGELFALDPDHPNVYAPGKRPFHTIIPAFVTRGEQPWLSFGVMGGGMQPQGHVQILTNLIDFGLGLQEAGDVARWRHDGSPEPTGAPGDGAGVVRVESGIPPSVRRALEAKGHRVEPGDGGFGGYQAILRDLDTGAYAGASEMRKDGVALGY